MASKRKLSDYYHAFWELIPVFFIALTAYYALIGYEDILAKLQMTSAEIYNENKKQFTLLTWFIPGMSLLIYLMLSVATFFSIKVKDPTKDLNWVLNILKPGKRVMDDTEAREEYRSAIIRILYLGKFFFAIGFLAFLYVYFGDIHGKLAL